jgi:RNA polymerase sigma-70 factor (ECF subfamily)
MTRPSGQPAGAREPAADDASSDKAMRGLYEAHGTLLLNHLIRLTGGDRHKAEDILQETLVRAWKHPEARSATGEWSRAWLFTVAQRIAIDYVRAAAVRPGELHDERIDERPEHHDSYERIIDQAEVRAALAALPDRLRDALIEIYFRDRSVAEAAETLGVPAGTVKSRTYYALRALREQLVDRGFFNGPDD